MCVHDISFWTEIGVFITIVGGWGVVVSRVLSRCIVPIFDVELFADVSILLWGEHGV
jgi:hypothetical protein